MNYSEIFNEIVLIAHQDYSGWEDKQGWDNPDEYLEKIVNLEQRNEMTPHLFSKLVNDYLLSFNDRHIYFTYNGNTHFKNMDCGFRVRRYKDTLYVTETTEENRFTIGTEIISLDGETIPELHRRYQSKLREVHPERENWNAIIQSAIWCEIVERNGHVTKIDIKEYDKEPRGSSYSLEEIEDGTLLMTIPDFMNPQAISEFISNNHKNLINCNTLIIDVRYNAGGMSMAFNPILKYIFPKTEKPNSIIKEKEFNCTERNAKLFAEQYEEVKQMIDDEDTLRMVEYGNEMFQSNIGNGFVVFDFASFIEDPALEFKGSDYIEKVVVLSDYYCGSAGDDFVEICKQSSKVTVVGRATMGVNDFSDLAVMSWGNEFDLSYPTSRLAAKTNIVPIHGTGIQPDIYILWTPEHIHEDIDLKKAIEITMHEGINGKY